MLHLIYNGHTYVHHINITILFLLHTSSTLLGRPVGPSNSRQEQKGSIASFSQDFGEFGDALWATAAYLVMRYGPLFRILLCPIGHYVEWSPTFKKKLRQFRSVGHSAGCGYELWAIVQA
jgi:hypothetical protein